MFADSDNTLVGGNVILAMPSTLPSSPLALIHLGAGNHVMQEL